MATTREVRRGDRWLRRHQLVLLRSRRDIRSAHRERGTLVGASAARPSVVTSTVTTSSLGACEVARPRERRAREAAPARQAMARVNLLHQRPLVGVAVGSGRVDDATGHSGVTTASA